MHEPSNRLIEYLLEHGISQSLAQPLSSLILLLITLLLAFVADQLARRVILRAFRRVADKTKTTWDNKIIEAGVFSQLAHLVPALVVYTAAPLIFPQYPNLVALTQRLAHAFVILTVALAAYRALNAGVEIYRSSGKSQRAPVKTYAQVGQIVVVVVATVLIVGTLMNRSPWALLSGIGALTAIIMLVFKDSILGFVSSVQLTANDMVRPGDWIEMPRYEADGDVIDVSLHTVKVQNWDKTISTIPTYQLMQESFKNWRGMSESGGRRIKRAINIDMSTIGFCDDEMLERFEQIELLQGYIKEKRAELQASNRERGGSQPTNLRRLTNVGTYRAYVVAYLRAHPKIHDDMTFLVRQLAPSERGLPLEIYVFCNDQVWARYEAIQADIFDHLLAVLPDFGLRAFQLPSGADVSTAFEQGSVSGSRALN